jgi:hypothetical protein
MVIFFSIGTPSRNPCDDQHRLPDHDHRHDTHLRFNLSGAKLVVIFAEDIRFLPYAPFLKLLIVVTRVLLLRLALAFLCGLDSLLVHHVDILQLVLCHGISIAINEFFDPEYQA